MTISNGSTPFLTGTALVQVLQTEGVEAALFRKLPQLT